MKLVFKKNPAIQVTAPKIKTINTGNYGWYDVEDCTDGGYEKILAPFSMAFWDLVEKQLMKYIDAERLRMEVKRLEKTAHKSALGCADSETRKFHEGKDFAYQRVGVLIDSLQQEQPEVDLEEAAAAIILKKHPIMKDAFTMEMAFYEMLELVKAGYELGLNARKEE